MLDWARAGFVRRMNRSQYKSVRNALSASERNVKMVVSGTYGMRA